jgi:hypothetical protein
MPKPKEVTPIYISNPSKLLFEGLSISNCSAKV